MGRRLLLFLIAVLLASVLFDHGSGLLATGLSALLAVHLFAACRRDGPAENAPAGASALAFAARRPRWRAGAGSPH